MVVGLFVEIGTCFNNDSIDSETNSEISERCLWGYARPVLARAQSASTDRPMSSRAPAATGVHISPEKHIQINRKQLAIDWEQCF